MVDKKGKSPDEQIVEIYRGAVSRKHSDRLAAWPVLSGYNSKIGAYKGWLIIILNHTGNPVMRSSSGIGELPESLIGIERLDTANKEIARSKLERHFSLRPNDGIVFCDPAGNLDDEIEKMLQRHEFAIGLTPMKIFLSHKGADKPLVREYKKTLEILGFDPWLDEDAMHAGTELERGILKGFSDSCAAIFFVTKNYKDENFLASEVDYAISEKRKKGDRFSIITLVSHEPNEKARVPELLSRYVWKEPSNHLEGLREIIKALPVQLGQAYWRP